MFQFVSVVSPLPGAVVAGGFAFDPAADPWGAAMLGAAALGVIALLMAMGRQFGGRRPGGAGWLLAFCSLAFLGIAGTSAAQRVREAPVDAEPPAEPAAPVTIEAPAVERDEDDPPAPPSVPEQAEPPAQPEGAAIPAPEALPTDPDERKAAVRAVLRSARLIYEDDDTCKSAEDVGEAWAAVEATGATSPRAQAVARRLEECRRSVRWAITYVVHRDRVDARNDFAETLSDRLSEAHGLKTFIKLSGKDHERMRMGSGKMDEALATTIMSDKLKAELTTLGFERVVLASGRSNWKTDLEPRSEASYVADKLRPFGLAAPLRLNAE